MKTYALVCATALSFLLCTAVQAQRWRAIVERANDQNVSFCNAFSNGTVRINPGPLNLGRDYRTRFELRDTFFVDNNFVIEARVKNSVANGGITAFDPGVYLEGCNINAGVSLMGDAWAQRFTSMYAHTAGISGLLQFVQDFSDWKVVRLEFKNNTFSVYHEGNLLHSLSYTGDITFIHKLTVRFKGSGLLDWLKLYDGNGQLMWQEDFTNCNNMAPAPAWKDNFNLQTGNDTTGCTGEPLRLTADLRPGATYQWTGPNGYTSNLQNPTINALNPRDTGLYTVIATYRGCLTRSGSMRVQLQATTPPPPDFLGRDTTLCLGDSLRLGIIYTCATYRWQDGSTNSTFSVNKSGTYAINITLNGQTYQDTIQVNYFPLPQVNLGTDTVLCPGVALPLNASIPNARTYRWQDGSTAPVFNIQNGGNYAVAVTDVCNNSTSDNITISYLKVLKNLNIGNDTTLCNGQSLLLNAYDSAATSYAWQDGSNQPTFTVNAPGTYAVTLRDACGNVTTDSVRVQYAPEIQAVNLGRDTTLCAGQTLQLNATNPAAARYRWQDGSANAIFQVIQPGTYFVTVQDNCNNVVHDTIQVDYFKTLQNLNLGRDTTVCPGATFRLNVQDSAAVSYRWQNGNNTPVFSVTQPGIYAVTLTDACSNIQADSIQIQYHSLIKTFSLGQDTTLCPGNQITLSAADSAAVSYRWQNNNANATLTVQTAGTYAVTISDACGNQFSDSIKIDYYKVLNNLNLGRDTTLCPGQTLLLNATDSAVTRYRWQDGSAASTFFVSQPGIYAVNLADNCGNTLADTIRVYYNQVLGSLNLGSDTTLCPGQTLLLSATDPAARSYRWQNGSTDSTFRVTQTGVYTAQISDACGNVQQDTLEVKYLNTLQNLNLGKDTSLCPGAALVLNVENSAVRSYRWQDGSTQPVFKIDAAGIYKVRVEDHCNNIFNDSIQVTYYQIVDKVDLGPKDTTLCVGETLLLDAGSKSDAQFRWQDGTAEATYTVTKPGVYQVQVSDFCGNKAADEIRVRYEGLPKAGNFVSDTIVCESEIFRLNATTPNAAFYQWQDGSDKPVYAVTQPGVYTVVIGNECGDTTYAVTIEMEYCGPCRTYIPNAFSPNGDGANDEFVISSECAFTHYELRIFDRWGVQVFNTITPYSFWDGRMNGTVLPTGVYVWQLRYKTEAGKVEVRSGDVLLVR
jgi:gliding motility-associated-like protein